MLRPCQYSALNENSHEALRGRCVFERLPPGCAPPSGRAAAGSSSPSASAGEASVCHLLCKLRNFCEYLSTRGEREWSLTNSSGNLYWGNKVSRKPSRKTQASRRFRGWCWNMSKTRRMPLRVVSAPMMCFNSSDGSQNFKSCQIYLYSALHNRFKAASQKIMMLIFNIHVCVLILVHRVKLNKSEMFPWPLAVIN